MDRTVGTVGVIIALLVVAGAIFYSGGGGTVETPPANATSTPVATSPPAQPVTPSPRQPGAPLVITGTNTSASETAASVTGTVNPNGSFTSYWYEYGTSSDLAGASASFRQSVGSGYAVLPAAGHLTGLARDTTYWFRLVAENAYGRSTGVTRSLRTTAGNPPPVGSAPVARTLAATGISRTTANLSGEVTPNMAATQFWFEYGPTTALGSATPLVAVGAGSGKSPVSLSVSDLNPLTTYYFRLNAQNRFGTVNGAILSFKTAGPAAATAPSVTTGTANSIQETSANLRGTVDPNGSATAYWFEYSTDSLLGAILLRSTEEKQIGAGTSPVAVSAAVSGLSPKTTYYYRLAARNAAGTAYGDRKSFRTD